MCRRDAMKRDQNNQCNEFILANDFDFRFYQQWSLGHRVFEDA